MRGLPEPNGLPEARLTWVAGMCAGSAIALLSATVPANAGYIIPVIDIIPNAASAEIQSAAGSAWPSDPPSVPRLRTAR